MAHIKVNEINPTVRHYLLTDFRILPLRPCHFLFLCQLLQETSNRPACFLLRYVIK